MSDYYGYTNKATFVISLHLHNVGFYKALKNRSDYTKLSGKEIIALMENFVNTSLNEHLNHNNKSESNLMLLDLVSTIKEHIDYRRLIEIHL